MSPKSFFSILLCVLFISCSNVKIKKNYMLDYYPYLYEAEIAFEQKEYEKSYLIYKKLFKNFKPKNTTTFYEIDKMARVSVILNKYNDCYKYIKIQIKQEGFKITKYKNDSLFNNFFLSKRGKKLFKNSENLRMLYLKKIDTSFVNKLVKMSENDQKYRNNKEVNWEIQKEIDSINKYLIKEILDTNGYPAEHLNRYITSGWINFDVILLHTDDEFRFNYVMPKILDEINNGKCSPKIYAQLYDQHCIYNNKKQIFGTFFKNRDTLAKHISFDSINQNRLKIGLPTLEQKKIIHDLKLVNYPDTYGKIFKK